MEDSSFAPHGPRKIAIVSTRGCVWKMRRRGIFTFFRSPHRDRILLGLGQISRATVGHLSCSFAFVILRAIGIRAANSIFDGQLGRWCFESLVILARRPCLWVYWFPDGIIAPKLLEPAHRSGQECTRFCSQGSPIQSQCGSNVPSVRSAWSSTGNVGFDVRSTSHPSIGP